MHGHSENFISSMSPFLGSYYMLIALLNGVAAFYLWSRKNKPGLALVWLVVGAACVVLAAFAYGEKPAELPQAFRDAVDTMSGAVTYTLSTTIALVVLFVFRKFFVQPVVAWAMFIGALILMGMSMTDPDFAAIVTKPDNVPIVGLVFLLSFFTWLATSRAVENDERAKQGLPPREKVDDEKVLVWPDLVYTELICMIALTALLIFWGIGLQAPLEEPASSVKTPNPSKAPWYFLGLQEMLVYYDPWMAGVVLPSVVIGGLMAIPYLDFNKKGNGYYTIAERPFSYIVFQIGFLELWITLIILGTFLRGPNWNFFGPYEYWDPHKVLALNNVDLSEFYWLKLLGSSMPRYAADAGFFTKLGFIIYREWTGIALVLAYFVLLPPILGLTVFRKFFVKMGLVRFMVMANLLLLMASLPLKMILRWSFNLKYIIAIPEYFLNF